MTSAARLWQQEKANKDILYRVAIFAEFVARTGIAANQHLELII